MELSEPELIQFPETPLTRIMGKVGGIYRANRRWTIMEIDYAKQALSHPTAESEADEIVKYFSSLAPHERRYFPNSVLRLLEKWQDILDKAALSQSFGQEPIKPTAQSMIWIKQLERVESAMAKLKAAHFYDDKWDSQDYRKQFNEMTQTKGELKTKLGFKV